MRGLLGKGDGGVSEAEIKCVAQSLLLWCSFLPRQTQYADELHALMVLRGLEDREAVVVGETQNEDLR